MFEHQGQLAQQLDKLASLRGAECVKLVGPDLQQRRHDALDELTAGSGQFDQQGSSIGGVRQAAYELGMLELVEPAGHRRRLALQCDAQLSGRNAELRRCLAQLHEDIDTSPVDSERLVGRFVEVEVVCKTLNSKREGPGREVKLGQLRL